MNSLRLGLVALCSVGIALLPASAQSPKPIDSTALRGAQPDEWLSYGRDYAETHYSPLAQIHRDNVRRLRLAWSWEIGSSPAQLEATPLVSNGVIYATGTWSVVFALDARTGAVKWRWDPGIVQGGRPPAARRIRAAAP